MIRLSSILFILLTPIYSFASTWSATQGDIIEVVSPHQNSIEKLSCFGKNWPFKRLQDGTTHAWIGIDLKQKTRDYPIVWHTNDGTVQDQLTVIKGQFRTSHIKVESKMANFDTAAIKRIRADQKAIKGTYSMQVEQNLDFSLATLPLKGIESTPFGAQRYVNGKARSPHSGVDIAAPKGTPVLSPLNGKVLLVEDMFLNGKLIAIGHGEGLVSVYAHLKAFHVQQGDLVKAGQIIAEVGSTGRSTGPHLHWGVRFKQARINPNSLLSLAKQ
ncbi:MAG: M23 family metallopeptidase [Mariprofundaceae bacterium]